MGHGGYFPIMQPQIYVKSLITTSNQLGETENKPLNTGGAGFTGVLFRFICPLPFQCSMFH
jgi:hypothetical protein